LLYSKELAILYYIAISKENVIMPKVSAKRQVTLPIEQCRQADINPGDEYECFVDNKGHITIVKKVSGSASGILKGIKTDKCCSDETSLQSAISS
jgi:bifunctional DNA-binding transcriptional regulator/antitoxin component of YhaV-PrlF toxin-antitoxin module